MKDPELYDDDKIMDELMDHMEGYDAKRLDAQPSGTVVEIHLHPNGKAESAEEAEPKTDEEGMLPTPEELDEMMRHANA